MMRTKNHNIRKQVLAHLECEVKSLFLNNYSIASSRSGALVQINPSLHKVRGAIRRCRNAGIQKSAIRRTITEVR